MHNAITGIHDKLYSHLVESIRHASSIRIAVAFLMESGVKLLLDPLLEAAERRVSIQILTGRYLSVTEPSAIYHLLHHLEDRVDIRFYEGSIRVFHPKAYIIEYGDEDGEIFVGSSNISLSALTGGVEWNYRLKKNLMPEDYQRFSQVFNELFNHHSIPVTDKVLKEYALEWKKPRLFSDPHQESKRPEPRGAQIEALYALKRAREEGIHKGLVVAATGIGKTYLSAFDSLKSRRVLYIAHREEILKQAYATFKQVRKGDLLGYYYGGIKDEGAQIYFSTVQTLSQDQHLSHFPQDFFDYLVVDEFHHAAAKSYQKLLNYFQPGFMLGLTATPYRSDNRDIFSLCDDHVLYEIHIKDAINRDLLVPFRYYGILDETDYEEIDYENGVYNLEQLEKELSTKERAGQVYEKYRSLAGEKTLAFCASINHAEYMAEYFRGKGESVAAVHSGRSTYLTMDRHDAIQSLEVGDLNVLFVVDIFNEGVDIPSLDTVLFLRPTESFIVFLQQLGRGLRQYEEKEYLRVIDFIGNYKRAHYIPSLLAGENPLAKKRVWRHKDLEYPEGCMVHFDFRLLDLFEELSKRDPLPARMEREYLRIKGELGRRPERLDLYRGTDIPFREYLKKGWLRFLMQCGDLKKEEEEWIGGPAEKFLKTLEKTSMSKSYKIPTLQSLLTQEGIEKKVSLKKVGITFALFYRESLLHQRDLSDKRHKGWLDWDLERFESEARRNPIRFLSRNKFFHYDEINRIFFLDESLHPYLSPSLRDHVKDILNYRCQRYFHTRYRNYEE